MAGNPAAAIALDPTELQNLKTSLGWSTTSDSDIGQFNLVLGILRNLDIQMAQSKIAPIIFNAGERVPFLGNGQTWPAS